MPEPAALRQQATAAAGTAEMPAAQRAGQTNLSEQQRAGSCVQGSAEWMDAAAKCPGSRAEGCSEAKLGLDGLNGYGKRRACECAGRDGRWKRLTKRSPLPHRALGTHMGTGAAAQSALTHTYTYARRLLHIRSLRAQPDDVEGHMHDNPAAHTPCRWASTSPLCMMYHQMST